MQKHKTIFFYSDKTAYAFLSNFYPARHTVFGAEYLTTEHSFQAQKFLWEKSTEEDKIQAEKIRIAKTPGLAKKLGNSRTGLHKLRPDWEEKKDSIMKEVVFAKFDQNEELKKLLFETGDALLVEDARNDYYWGRGASGKGKNKLGHILMEVRAELKEKEEKKEKENEKEKK